MANQDNKLQLKQGDLCHMDVPTQDRERAKRFYGEVFGWTFQDIPEMDYSLFTTPGSPIGGGLFTPDETSPRTPLVYLSVVSIEDAAAQIERFGGKSLSPKIEVPGQGWLMNVSDSEGNTIAIWQSK